MHSTAPHHIYLYDAEEIHRRGTGMIHLSTLLNHYKRPDVQAAIVDAAADREVGIYFAGHDTYGKRPEVLTFPRDVLSFVQKGATSFHIGEERWSDPLRIVTGMSRRELDELRSGWDLVLDIDCPWLEFSQVAAHVLVERLRSLGIRCLGVKFSGNHGFHIGVPFEAFPKEVHFEGCVHAIASLFPDGPRKIAAYLQDEIRLPLGKLLIERFGFEKIRETSGKTRIELIRKGPSGDFLDPFALLAIDTVLIASRHLIRAPYSMHEKSGLVSIPIDPSELLTFDKRKAESENVKADKKFLDRAKAKPDEARLLFESAFSHKLATPLNVDEKEAERGIKNRPEMLIPTQALPENVFPPCMKAITAGIKDGKKRALFAAVNFLVLAGWEYDAIDKWVEEWNKRNPDQMREVIIKSHLRHHRTLKEKMPPPNCRKYYEDIGVCHPDSLCDRIKNPIQYAKRRMFLISREQEKPKRGKKTADATNKTVEKAPDVK